MYERPLDTLLENPLFNSWVKYVDAKYPEMKATVIETLTRRYGVEDVVKMLSTAKKEDAIRTIATKLESELLEMWLSSGKSVKAVFKLLKLNDPTMVFVKNPLLKTWVPYMNVVVKENPSEALTMLSTLETILDDKRLNQVLLISRKHPSMERAVDEQRIPQEVLDDVGESIFSHPLFHTWMKYVKNFIKKKNPCAKNPELEAGWRQ
ncbi:hypothetical protein PF005_g25392 [Phytophthora fragariae]|uniref:RXLR phytopathogen effector protein WY-domain domain-containing protein n=1 Tax=Phytophthora fragariae TaxID=53985 RepID=A0A6A3XBT0_9STRA|nr:hypothetical protein PF003_g11456 [Phytophthora fragariae]KAE8928971.1 hypothetical protein PF009_g20905 [Phytophthora fragariae]KAE8983673.1 hypothetical protein PF011_g21081 [Phytophthora fragariae]KAE9068975.1 hypothetical protein PF010_g26842 [Phytophthora fragariae]KAE9082073.1 hypothetical protein PF007_g22413 [Phytophthora fragariae]